MSEFPNNCYDPNIVNQPEIEYRNAKYPFRQYREFICNGEIVKAVFRYCPVCFWNKDMDMYDALINKGAKFCEKCGQKIKWEEEKM